LYGEKRIVPAVNKVFKFEKAKKALLYLESGGHFGEVVVKIGSGT
jgi:hypothetical protein